MAEKGTPKYIANKIKSKGLQKLRWFCQMCEKQCRDENGFKCHTSSEAHQRQLLLFAETPESFLDAYSGEFEKTFISLLSRCHGTKRTFANAVYQEYIKEKLAQDDQEKEAEFIRKQVELDRLRKGEEVQ